MHGEPAEAACRLGVFVKCPHAEMIEAIGLAGFDFAVVDMEHTPLGPRDLYPLVLAAERRQLSLVVRIPCKREEYFKWCRDLDIAAIQVPHIETKEDALRAVESSYFAPRGERGLCRFVRAAGFSAIPKEKYLREANARNRLILQIEGQRGIENLPQILEVTPPEASIFIGPYDLSQSLGKPGQIWDSEVIEAMDRIVALCRDRGIGVGTFTDTLAGISHWANRGVSFVEYASDLHLFLQGAAAVLKTERT
jgi:4-hydroxy-2-oxoheptanedioate aldolase